MSRLSTLFVLGGAALLITPLPASAQFRGAFGLPGGRPPLMVPLVPTVPMVPTVPLVRPVSPVPPITPVIGFPRFRAQSSSSLSFSNFHLFTQQSYVGLSAWAFRPVAGPIYAYSGTYATMGGYAEPDFIVTAERNLMRAQRQATLDDAVKSAGTAAPNDAVPAVPANGAEARLPTALPRALAPAKSEDIASGAALNDVLVEIARVAPKSGEQKPSAYIPPQVLKNVQFAGSPSSDLLNLARRRPLEIPSVFDTPALSFQRSELSREFASVVERLRTDKPLDAAHVARLESALQALEKAATPVFKELKPEQASEGRRFLNRMDGAVAALKDGHVKGLIDPNWDAEGLSGADLAKHMLKHKLQFGPAPRGEEESYETVHKNLATYLFILTQPKKK